MRGFVRCIFLLLTTSCLFDWTVVPKDKGASGSEACKSNEDCAATSYCKWADSLCGQGDVVGTCTTRPKSSSCGDDEKPVCDCKTNAQGGACVFAAEGVDVNASCQ